MASSLVRSCCRVWGGMIGVGSEWWGEGGQGDVFVAPPSLEVEVSPKLLPLVAAAAAVPASLRSAASLT